MDLRDHFLALTDDERGRFAATAGTTVNYITTHLIAPPERRKIPRPALLEGLVTAGGGAYTREDLLAFFYAKVAA